MALVNPVDPSVERVSACPVHFIWDGRGFGRVLVRSGFLALLAAGMLAMAASFVRMPVLSTAALVVVAGGLGAWLAGQAVSFAVVRRARR